MILLSSSSILDNLNIKGFSIVDSSYDGVISIREVYQEPLVLLQNKPLAIVFPGGQSAFKQGEKFTVDDVQYINHECPAPVSVQSKVTTSLGITKGSNTKIVSIYDVMYASMIYKMDVDTSQLSPGNYLIEVRWFCDGVELGKDGYIDSNKQPSVANFEVLSSDDPDDPDPACKIRSCQGGQKLVNPDSVDCYCQNEWLPDNGQCEIGEPRYTPDCVGTIKCSEDKINIEGICLPKNIVCEEDGGTRVCDDDDNPPGFKFDYNIIVILGIIAVIIAIIMRRNK